MAKLVDTVSMSKTESTATTFDQDCLAVLECYAVRDAAAKTSNSDYAGWLDRILSVPGLDAPCLTSIHGFLIAQGLIKFEFTGRSVGLQYQLSTLGRESIARRSLCVLDDARNADGTADMQSEGVAQAA